MQKSKEDQIHLTHEGILIVNGKEYIESHNKMKKIDGVDHIDKVAFTKFNRKEFNKKVDFISMKIEGVLDKEELVKELIKKKATNEINKLYDLLKKIKKPKMKKQKGCLGIKIGSGKRKTNGGYIQLID